MRVLSKNVVSNDGDRGVSLVRIKLSLTEQAMIGKVHRFDPHDDFIQDEDESKLVSVKIKNAADLSACLYGWFGEFEANHGHDCSGRWFTSHVEQVRKCGRREYIMRVNRSRDV